MARSTATGVALAGVAIAGVLVLAGCVPGAPAPVPAETAALPSSTPTSSANALPELVPGGTAKDNQPYFDRVNLSYFNANDMGTSRGIVDNLVAAGFRKQDIEITADRTSIDLKADSIIFSVRLKGECLIGDFTATTIKSMVAPILGTGGCLIGKTVTIDW